MIGIKDQCFGVEIELTGITRAEAAEALAAYFETTPQRSYDNYLSVCFEARKPIPLFLWERSHAGRRKT